tara:strand:+ start:422 stop:1237 length:816 start_codon:yes stop_codon:yes gene_type:complete
MYKLFRKIYSIIFSNNTFLQKINNRVLDLALSAKGYNNFRDFHESGEKFFVKKYLANNSTKLCIDIGANEGNFTSLLLEETSSKVISFEPLPSTYKTMLKQLRSQYTDEHIDRCVFINKGVGAKSEILPIYYNEKLTTHSSFSQDVKEIDYVEYNNKVDVEVVSLDEFCKLNSICEIDFIKIDTEGFEKEVFEGALETFSSVKPKYIQIEYNWHHLFRNTSLNFFAKKLTDYNVYQLTYNSMRRVDTKHPFSNIYLFSNFVFVRKDCDKIE